MRVSYSLDFSPACIFIYMTPGIPLFTPGSPKPGTTIGAFFSVVVLNTGKNFAIPLLGPYASSIKYTATRHQASSAENIQKYAATLMPIPTPFPYANKQQAIVVPMAREKRRVARITSRAHAAIAYDLNQYLQIKTRREDEVKLTPTQVNAANTTNQDASSGRWA
jgi:hypothetical protein